MQCTFPRVEAIDEMTTTTSEPLPIFDMAQLRSSWPPQEEGDSDQELAEEDDCVEWFN